MGKSHRLIRLAQQKGFLAKFAGTFLATLGLPSALLTILGKHFSVALTSELVVVATLFAILVNWRSLKHSYLPVGDIIPGNLEEPANTYVHCPCSLKLSDEAKALAGECYAHDKNSITPERFEQLRVRNPLILACLTSSHEEFLGYFDAIPLREPFAQSLLKGIVTENQITHEDVLPIEEMKSCRYLFISGLAVWDAESYGGGRNASMLVWALLKYLDKFYSAARPVVFAIASTEQGEELMRRFKLAVSCDAFHRIDKCPVFAVRLSGDEIARRLACLPDWSPLCTLEWDDKETIKSPTKRHRRPGLPKSKAYSLPAAVAPRAVT
jgi:hypothetical protein